MEIIGAVFSDESILNPTLQALEEAGFETYMVFGADDFSGEPDMDAYTHSATRQHTPAGSVSGIRVDPDTEIPDDPSTETVRDELMSLGLTAAEARDFVEALHDDRLLLLVPTWTGKSDTVETIMRSHSGRGIRRIHPEDSFPEELWRPRQPD